MPRLIPAKTILSKFKNAPDPWFGITYNMNLYRGCQHQCIYCDSRSECYQLGDLADIRIKENALNILEKELKTKRLRATVGFGSMNDPYMPVERHQKLVRGALELLIKYNYPVHLLTKSDLILRDIDLLKKLSAQYLAASFTITTVSDDLSKIIEPGAPVSSKRLDAMKQLSDVGIYTGVMLMPILPFVNDNLNEILELVNACKANGAKYLLFAPALTLREGSREYFYEKLEEHFPGIKEKYISSFGNNYNCYAENANILFSEVQQYCVKLDLSMKMNFFERKNPDQLSFF